jgi:hypothetical protein
MSFGPGCKSVESLEQQCWRWFRGIGHVVKSFAATFFARRIDVFWTALTNHSGNLKYPTTLRIDLQRDKLNFK